MKLISVSEATTVQLDWLVAKCDNQLKKWYVSPDSFSGQKRGITKWECVNTYWRPTKSWAIMGAIIQREQISLASPNSQLTAFWVADSSTLNKHTQWDHNPLIAAARCFIESKLGFIVEVPEEI